MNLRLIQGDCSFNSFQTVGNHEFDHGVEGVVPFLERINSPVVICNVDDTEEPTMKGLYTDSMVITKHERRIGVIGVILQTTNVSRFCFTYLYRDT